MRRITRITGRNWEGLARQDPFWAICTHPSKRDGKWETDAFFNSGTQEIDTLFHLGKLDLLLPDHSECLDFGCGAGRLTRALAGRFDRVTGIDISPTMVQTARDLNGDISGSAVFLHHDAPGLSLFPSDRFSMVLSLLVLQHLRPELALSYLEEMMRVLKPGGVLVVQAATRDLRRPGIMQLLRATIRIRERLALAGIGKGFSMHMHVIEPDAIREACAARGGAVLMEQCTNQTDPSYAGILRFIKEEESVDYVSRLFVVKKTSVGR